MSTGRSQQGSGGDAHAERPAASRAARSYFPEVESLRGWAIGLVFAVHLDYVLHARFGPPAPESFILHAVVHGGATGVDLFFVLSAFLLSLPFFRAPTNVNFRRYFLRRALRIYPAYTLLVLVAVALRATEIRDLFQAIPYLLFLNGFPHLATPLTPYTNVLWSLATEVQFYLVLPLLPLCLRSRRGRYFGIALLLSYAALYAAFNLRLFAMPSFIGQRKLEQSLFGRAPLFLAGMFVAWIYARSGEQIAHRWRAIRWLRNGGADAALIGVLVALALLLRWTESIGWFWQDLPPFHAWHVPEAMCWSSLLFLLLVAPLRLRPILSNRPLAWLGKISYSLYLIHYPILSLGIVRMHFGPTFAAWSPAWKMASVALLLTTACLMAAALAYRLVERPFLKRKARMVR